MTKSLPPVRHLTLSKAIGVFDGLTFFWPFLSARLGSQRGGVLEILVCAARRTVRVSLLVFHVGP